MWGNSMQNDDMHSAGSCMASGQPPDDALILRIAQGDTAALEVLYRQTSSSIYGFALSILRDPVAAEDVMQDTFVSVMQSAPGYQPSGKPMAWLLTIARNLALMRLRRAESKNLSFDELFHVEDTHDAYQTTENHMVLEKVLHTLTDGERQIVMLHALSGLKHREIADLLVAVNRPYGKSDYIPCICWGRNARYAGSFEVGAHCAVWGRIQSREYMKKLSEDQLEKRIAYEVSVSKLERMD